MLTSVTFLLFFYFFIFFSEKPLGPQMANRLSFIFIVTLKTEGCDISQEDVCAHRSLARLCGEGKCHPSCCISVSIMCSQWAYVACLLELSQESQESKASGCVLYNSVVTKGKRPLKNKREINNTIWFMIQEALVSDKMNILRNLSNDLAVNL